MTIGIWQHEAWLRSLLMLNPCVPIFCTSQHKFYTFLFIFPYAEVVTYCNYVLSLGIVLIILNVQSQYSFTVFCVQRLLIRKKTARTMPRLLKKNTNQTNTMYWVHFKRVSINQNQLKTAAIRTKKIYSFFFLKRVTLLSPTQIFITKVWYSVLNVQLLFCWRAPSCDNFDKLLGNMHEENHSLTKSSL